MNFISGFKRLCPQLIGGSVALLIIILFFTQEAYSTMIASTEVNEKTVIEHLRLHVDTQDREAWLVSEKGSWEQWLAKKKGFLGRQLFWDPLREEATLLITWASYSQWKDIPQGEIDAVQERFEKLAREKTGREFGNPFPLIYEGELLPQ